MPKAVKKIINPAAEIGAQPVWDAWCAPGFISAYYACSAARGYHIIRRRGTDSAYLVFTLAGAGFFRGPHGQVHVARPGDLLLMEPRGFQEYGILPGQSRWNKHWVHFDPPAHWKRWLPLPLPLATPVPGLSAAGVPSPARRRELDGVLRELHLLSSSTSALREALAMNLLERVLLRAVEQGPGSGLDPRVERVLACIQAKPYDHHGVKRLAGLAGLSASRLAHLFKQQTGQSLLKAMNQARLEAAKLALGHEGLSLAAAADKAGFGSPYSFSKWFLQQTGLRPGAFRRKTPPPDSPPQPKIRK